MPKVVHIKDLNKFPFVSRFHVKVLDVANKSNDLILTTKDIDLATNTAKKVKNESDLGENEKVIVTKEQIIQMY